jgi:hypothetical protein
MFDEAAQNSYSLFKLQNNVRIDLYRGGLKIIFLKIILCLIFKLVNLKWRNYGENVIDRINIAKANNFQGIKKYLKRILLDFYSQVIIIF